LSNYIPQTSKVLETEFMPPNNHWEVKKNCRNSNFGRILNLRSSTPASLRGLRSLRSLMSRILDGRRRDWPRRGLQFLSLPATHHRGRMVTE
jgi:hypothetical protein